MRLRELNVGCFGGGTGLPSLLGGLKANPWLNVNAVVTMFDSGGSSGQLRDELGVLPPGDIQVESYVQKIGSRLVESIPPEFQHSEFRYSFKVVNVSDINAFALPGGPIYVNRGMIEAAKTEGEVAGVMAHELSHVALRHGTAQQSKATPYEIGSVAGQILGAIMGARRAPLSPRARSARVRHSSHALQPRA
jgi:predicted Zn-dependent protease